MNRIVQAAVMVAVVFSMQTRTEMPGDVVENQEVKPDIHCEVGHHRAAPQKVIIDTDPANGYMFRDIDDGLMLAMALSNPSVEVLGITIGFGNTSTEKGYAKAKEILHLAGRTSVPVLYGSSVPGAGNESEASRFIVEQAHKYPGRVKVLAVGALTNVAAALHADPDIVHLLQEVVTVGGNVVKDRDRPEPGSPYDLNYGSDPDCARMVFESGAPVTLVSIELCRQALLTWSDLRRAASGSEPLAKFLLRTSRSWMLVRGGKTVPWDVVGLSYIVHPEWYTATRRKANIHVHRDRLRPIVAIELDGRGSFSINLLSSPTAGDAVIDWIGVSI